MKTIVTTGGRPSEAAVKRAQKIARDLQYAYYPRNKRSIYTMQNVYNCAILVVGTEKIELYRIGMEKPFFFHPNSASFRLKRIQAGGRDPLIEVAQLKSGASFLDCTLGLASDSIIASFIVGPTARLKELKGIRMFLSSSEMVLAIMYPLQKR